MTKNTIPGLEFLQGRATKMPKCGFENMGRDLQGCGAKILLRRGGGLGDTIFALSIASKIKSIAPRATITFDCMEDFVDLVKHAVDVDTVRVLQQTNKDPDSWANFDYLIDFAGVIEGTEQRKTTDYFQLHLDRAGLGGEVVLPRFDFARTRKRQGGYLVVHTGGTNFRKQWPLDYWNILLGNLLRMSVPFYVVGISGDPVPAVPLDNILIGKLSLDDVAELIAGASCFVGTDSGLTHLAGVLGTPSLSMWGPFDPLLTLPNYKKATFLKSPKECCPCHVLRTREYPDKCTGDCLSKIKPSIVLSKLENVGLPHSSAALKDIIMPVKTNTPLALSFIQDAAFVPKFQQTEEAPRVSVVIPTFNTKRFLPRMFDTIRRYSTIPYETVLVSDGDSPYVGTTNKGLVCTSRKEVVRSRNGGFAVACNCGVAHADPRAEYICLLNADTEVMNKWLEPMVKFLDEHPEVAVVGNKHLNADSSINSIGSEFSWTSESFAHVGRNSVDHNEASKPVERDMVTFACVLIRRSVFDEVDGFDEGYVRGYWEDTDFCMKVRSAGYKIYYVPGSGIVHYVGKSSGVSGGQYQKNKMRFHQRWVQSGIVDKFVRQRGRRAHAGDIVACYIVLNEGEYIQPSLESIYPLADRIVIVEGGNDYAVAAGLCRPDKRSTDDTIAKIQSFNDVDNKITLIEGEWDTKVDQRNAYVKHLSPGDTMLLMDGDEVFTDAGLWRLSYFMHRYDVIRPGYWVFWNDFNTVGTGRWDEYAQVKVVKWLEGYHYLDHNAVADANGQDIRFVSTVKTLTTQERLYCHYAWVKPLDKLRKKVDYYINQVGRISPNYFDDVFIQWRKTPLAVVASLGTHPFGKGGACQFTEQHPQSIQSRIDSGEYAWIMEDTLLGATNE